MRGEKSQVFGTIGGYEVGANWKWQLQFDTVSKCSLAVLLVLVVFLTLISTFLCTKSVELNHLENKILNELEEVQKLKQEIIAWNLSVSKVQENVPRGKRSLMNSSFQLTSNQNKRNKRTSLKTDNDKSTTKLSTSFKSKTFAVHLERNLSDYFVTESNGLLTRWIPQYKEGEVTLGAHNTTLMIPTDGIYYIYAQLCFAKSKAHSNGLEVRLMRPDENNFKHSKMIAQCNTAISSLDNHVTCHTSTSQWLKKGSKIFVQTTQKNSSLLMNDARSFFGIFKV